MKNDKEELWLHISTFTIAVVRGNFGEFKWNGKTEESFWGVFRTKSFKEHGWILIGEL